MNRWVKYGLRTLGVLALTGIASVAGFSYYKANTHPYGTGDLDTVDVPRFTEVAFPFSHRFDKARALPFLGSAIIDIDGDGTPEVFMGGGIDQPDAILEFDGKGFRDATASKGRGLTKQLPDTTYGVAVIDADGNGRTDLFVTRDSGVTLYSNTKDGFVGKLLDIPLNAKSTALSIALADLDNDGAVDMYLSSYLKLKDVTSQTNFDPGYGATSLLLMNNGDNTFRDVTKSAGVRFVHNTFTAVFSDVDRDGDQDLVVAHDTGRVRIYRNRGDGTFEKAKHPGSRYCGYPMGIAVGDYDNNGQIDFFFSNVGHTPPRSIARGVLPDGVYHPQLMLFRNNGGFKMDDAAVQAKVADYEFSWGSVFDDLNNDGREDLVIAQNYVDLKFQKLFKLPGRVLMQKPDGTFATAEREMGVVNRKYEITPLLADFNNDGYRDMVRVNLAGKSRAFLNEGGTNGYVKVRLPETPASLGAIVDVTLADGTRRTQQWTVGEGLASDQSHELIFGLGKAAGVESLEVTFAGGRKVARGTVPAGRTVTIE